MGFHKMSDFAKNKSNYRGCFFGKGLDHFEAEFFFSVITAPWGPLFGPGEFGGLVRILNPFPGLMELSHITFESPDLIEEFHEIHQK